MKELTCAVCKKPADYILHNKYGQPLNICESCYKYLWGPMPIGKWIFHKDYNESCRYGCNLCGDLNNIPSNFCPNCGAEMQKDGAELYREETCKSKNSCDDYKYWHCIGCNGCKKGGSE